MLHFHHAVSKDDFAGIKMVEGSRYTGVDEQLFIILPPCPPGSVTSPPV